MSCNSQKDADNGAWLHRTSLSQQHSVVCLGVRKTHYGLSNNYVFGIRLLHLQYKLPSSIKCNLSTICILLHFHMAPGLLKYRLHLKMLIVFLFLFLFILLLFSYLHPRICLLILEWQEGEKNIDWLIGCLLYM